MGSGKSYVSNSFFKHGIPVYDSDKETKKLLNENVSLKKEIISKFGEGCYVDGKWNRDYIVEKASNDSSILTSMGKMIDPYLVEDFKKFKSSCKNFAAIESAILIKSKGLMDEIDKLLVVTAPLEIRMERIKKRDPFRSDREIKMLLDKQPSVQLCQTDFMIDNDGNKNVDDAVVSIINRLLP